MPGCLYLVATPIGNLGDISARALATLRQVAVIACEDTRVTRKLLTRYGITTPTVSCHHHSAPAVLDGLVARLVAGESIAYVADAGTPGIADPGGKLVARAAAAGIRCVPIPGPAAVTAALSVAGFNTQHYLFLGFPPHKKGRATFFRQVAESEVPVVFYESTHRILKALAELAKLTPTRPLVVCRELTKVFESVYRGPAAEVTGQLAASSTKGEFVVMVGEK